MDMKRILQAMDGVATKPVAGVNDMKKFVSIIQEGVSPHKVALPVQMAMQHFQSPTATTENTSHIKTSVRKFFREVEEQTADEIATEQDQKRRLIKQYSQTIAERVLMKEARDNPQTSPTVQQDDSPKNSALNYTGDNVNVIRFLDKAKQGSGSGAKNDFEAAVTAAASMADTAQRQQSTIEQQQERERKLQRTLVKLQNVLDDTNDRFAELTAKVASGDISDKEAALISQEIDKDSKAQRAEIERTKDHDHKDHDDEEEKPVASKEEPKAVAKPAVKKAVTPNPKIASDAAAAPSQDAPVKQVKQVRQVKQVDPFQVVMNPEKVARQLAKSTATYPTTTNIAPRDVRGNIIPQPQRISRDVQNNIIPQPQRVTQPLPRQAHPHPLASIPQSELNRTQAILSKIGEFEPETAVAEDAAGAFAKPVVKLGATVFGELVKAYKEFHPSITLMFGRDTLILPRDKMEQLLVRYGQLDQAGREKFINTVLTNKQRLLGFIELTQHMPKPRINYKRVPTDKMHKPVKTVKQAPATDKNQLDLPLPPPEPEQGTLFELASFTLGEHTVPGHSMGFKPGAGFSGTQPVEETPIAMDPSEPNNPLIHSHQQANSATLNDRIERTRSQLKELSDIAEKAGNNLVAWERICMLAKGGFFMGLEQNLEQIRHGIGELSKKRKQGGVQSRGIDKNIG